MLSAHHEDQAKQRKSKLEGVTKKAFMEIGQVAMKMAALFTGRLTMSRRERKIHDRSRDWSTEDNY